MDLGTTLQIILLVIMIVVVFFELWLMRRRKGATKVFRPARRDDEFDEAHNAISSTEKIAAIMRGQGVDTIDAESMLREAKRAHARGDRTYAMSKANAARTALMNARKYSTSVEPIARPTREFIPEPDPLLPGNQFDAGASSDPEQSPEEIPQDSAPKLPENYMQSKFMISAAEGSIRSATSKGRDVSAADKALMQARAAFDSKEFGKALSLALKAKKMAEGLPAGATPQDGGAGVTDVGAPVADGVERWKEENPTPKGASKRDSEMKSAESLACPDCSAAVSTDDAFCRKCGGKLEFQLACPGCAADIEKNDAFCRKCGTKLA